MTADRNLLLGILALQMDFIDRDQLIAAMNAWVLEKSQPLEDLLVEGGQLSAERCELLRALVAEHLKQHDNDPQRSLRTLMPLGAGRAELNRQIADSDVQATLAIVATDRSDDSEPEPTVSHSVGERSSAGTRFRILRPHARGGIGKVAVALDVELGREVALKEIQERYADDPYSRSRFVMEAEVTGGLEHPGIVPVYGLGHYADGRPFYAMRFIRGNSFKEAIERFHDPKTKQHQDETVRSLEFRKLLGRLIDVCNAIEYAHSRGVLHRDLKPANVMLGKFGETLVVDWGLAKAVGRDDEYREASDEPTLQPASSSGSAPTEMGSAIGTPAYMSPEQAAGRLDRLGPSSDVYSLGATLFALLTGRSPFENEPTDGDLLQRVQRGEFPRPGELDRNVPAALEAICLKAMSVDPAARYATPSELAEDLEHWLADEPVAVHRESLGQRLGRWERKHRSYVRAGGIALLLVTIVSLAAAVGINQARQQQTAERIRADENAESERQAAAAAREAEREAQANLARAIAAELETEKALAQAESEAESAEEVSDFLVNLFLGSDPSGIGGGLGEIEARGSEMSAVELLKHGAKSLNEQINAKPDVRARLMDTLGFIFTTYSEYDTAEPLLAEALELRRELFDDRHPQLAESLKHSALFYFLTGDYRTARKYDREALAICRDHFGPTSGPAAEMMFLLGWHLSIGYTSETLLSESEELLRQAVEIQQELYGAADQRTIFGRLLLAHTLINQGRTAEGTILVMRASQALAEVRGDARPVEIITNLIGGIAAEQRKDWDQAGKKMSRAQELVRSLLGVRHPLVTFLDAPIANYFEQAGDNKAAESLLRKIVASERETFGQRPWVSYRLEDLAEFMLRHDRFDEAQEYFEEALQIRRATLGDDSVLVGSCLSDLAEVARRRGDPAQAEVLFREALAVYDVATQDDPDTVLKWRSEAASSLAEMLDDL